MRITVKWVNRVSYAIHNNLFSSSWQPYWSKNESFVNTSSFLYCFPRATQMCGFFVVIAMCFHFKFNAKYRHANLLFLSVVLGVLAFKGLNGMTTLNTVQEIEGLKTELKLNKAVSLDMETPIGPFIVLSIFFAPTHSLNIA